MVIRFSTKPVNSWKVISNALLVTASAAAATVNMNVLKRLKKDPTLVIYLKDQLHKVKTKFKVS